MSEIVLGREHLILQAKSEILIQISLRPEREQALDLKQCTRDLLMNHPDLLQLLQ